MKQAIRYYTVQLSIVDSSWSIRWNTFWDKIEKDEFFKIELKDAFNWLEEFTLDIE